MTEQNATPETEATEPKVDKAKLLAETATTYLDKDKVTRAQATVYRDELFGNEDPFDGGLLDGCKPEDAMAWAGKTKETPTEVRARLRDAYSHLKPSHQWLKAVIATAVAMHQDESLREA